MLIRIPWLFRTLVKSSLVINIYGQPCKVRACSRQLTQNSVSKVFEILHASTFLLYQSMITHRYINPPGMGK